MKELWIKLKEWWSTLALREKQAVSIGAALLILFITYEWIWTNALESVEEMREKIISGQKTLVWMEEADKQIKKMEGQSQTKSHATSPVELLSQIKKQIQRAGLEPNLTQLKQSTKDSIEVHFQRVEFDKLMGMLGVVIKEQNISIQHM